MVSFPGGFGQFGERGQAGGVGGRAFPVGKRFLYQRNHVRRADVADDGQRRVIRREEFVVEFLQILALSALMDSSVGNAP